jgi:hypothetical protein
MDLGPLILSGPFNEWRVFVFRRVEWPPTARREHEEHVGAP